MRRFLTLLMVLSMLLVPTLAHAEAPIRLFVGAGEVQADVPPVIEGGRTLVPVRALTEALGFTVTWDGATETATLTRASLTIQLTVGKQEALVNGKVVTMDVPAVNRDGRLLIPVRFVSEQLGAKVTWDGTNRVVTVELPAAAAPTQPAQPAQPPAHTNDPAAIALLEKTEQFQDVKGTGDFTLSIGSPMGTMDIRMQMEVYSKGQDSLTLSTVNIFGMTQKTGTALRGGQFWILEPATGVWTKSEAPDVREAIDNPANYAKLDDEMLKLAKISMNEQSYEGKSYDVVTVTMDVLAVAELTGQPVEEMTEAEMTMLFWIDKATGMQHHVDITLAMTSAEATMNMEGTLFFEAWEQAIPFPAEITQ